MSLTTHRAPTFLRGSFGDRAAFGQAHVWPMSRKQNISGASRRSPFRKQTARHNSTDIEGEREREPERERVNRVCRYHVSSRTHTGSMCILQRFCRRAFGSCPVDFNSQPHTATLWNSGVASSGQHKRTNREHFTRIAFSIPQQHDN